MNDSPSSELKLYIKPVQTGFEEPVQVNDSTSSELKLFIKPVQTGFEEPFQVNDSPSSELKWLDRMTRLQLSAAIAHKHCFDTKTFPNNKQHFRSFITFVSLSFCFYPSFSF